MKIAIYGGSFNPPHLGHIRAAETVARELSPDVFLIIPDNIPPHKEMYAMSPSPEERMELCRLSFGHIPGAVLSDMEITREGKSYTFDTVSAVREKYPDDELFLVMGTDMLLMFEDWYHFRYLLENCTLAVLARADGDHEEISRHAAYLRSEYGARIEILTHEPFEVSSTDIRERLQRRMGADMIDDKAYSLIIKNCWYGAQPELMWLREQAYSYLKPSRIAHVAGCESEAVLLANLHGEDAEKAATAGILHDVTKKLTADEQLLLCGKYGIINSASELAAPQVIHAKTGARFAAEQFGISEDICDAIRWHTTGKPDMTLLEKIVYLADFVEPTRSFPGVDELRELAYKDVDKAMARALEMSLEFIRSRGGTPIEDTVRACEWYNCIEE